MKNSLPLILLLFITFSTLEIKSQNIKISQTIDWNHHSNFWNPNETFNCIDNSYPLNRLIHVDSIKIIKTTYSSISNEEKNILDNKKILFDSINVEFKTAVERKKTILSLYIQPIQWNKTSNQYEKLSNIEFEIIEHNSKQKSTPQLRDYSNNSLLNSGEWYKIGIDTTGVFKLTYDELFNMGISNPANVRLFGYGGKQLSYMNSADNYDDLVENPILINKGSDGIFNSGDYILFYGEGSLTWTYDETNKFFSHKIHDYSNKVFYFLTSSLGEGKKIMLENNDNLVATYQSNSFDSYRFHEFNSINLIRSGRGWWGERFKQNEKMNFEFTFPNLVNDSLIYGKTTIAARRGNGSPICFFRISYEDELISQIDITRSYSTYVWGHQSDASFRFKPSSNNINLEYQLTGGDASIEAHLDFICLNAREYIAFNNKNQLHFRDVKTIKEGQITQFSIKNSFENAIVWDVSNPINPIGIKSNFSNGITTFKAKTDQLSYYIAFDPSNTFKPNLSGDNIKKIENQNLHALSNTDMVIVYHPKFKEYAEEIAELHQTKDQLNVCLVTPEEVYNEFSSGTPDVTAIRNFMRMLYDRSINDDDMVKYLLLMGDGSYDNKSVNTNNSNYILTYQSEESLIETSSFVTDDFFGLLDADEGGKDGALDIGIGRYPVQDTSEARAINDKIKNYLSENSLGSWRNQICFIADDADSDTHMIQANKVSIDIIEKDYPAYNTNKIFLDAYPRVSTPMGHRYPDVTKAINEQIKRGALIIDYVGHGNPRLLAHEEILTVPDVQLWRNFDKLGIFVTASCEVGRYDDFEKTSLGEWIVLNPKGGGVAALTTTRVVYSGDNDKLNRNFFRQVLNPELRLGDVIRLSKNNTSSGINKRNFSLLGDPALKLAIPESIAKVNYINDFYVMEDPSTSKSEQWGQSLQLKQTAVDTLNALSKATVAGEILDHNGNLNVNYNGILQVSIYDKPDSIICYGHTTASDVQPFSFKVQNSILYQGQANISNGTFDFEFIIPKDINYKYGQGKISLYAKSEFGEAIGYSDDFYIGGVTDKSTIDNEGPEIKLFINDSSFISGGITNENPIFIAQLFDDNGINTTGNGVGHNITATLDGDQQNQIILNNFYQGYIDKYNCGEINYPFYNLSDGEHTLTLTVWDIYNNSSEQTINFIVKHSKNIEISQLQNSPNPFWDETWFSFEHNQSFGSIDVTINIFDLMGHNVAQLKHKEDKQNFNIEPIYWDGTNFNGSKLPKGIYIYRIEIRTIDNTILTQSSKLMIFE